VNAVRFFSWPGGVVFFVGRWVMVQCASCATTVGGEEIYEIK